MIKKWISLLILIFMFTSLFGCQLAKSDSEEDANYDIPSINEGKSLIGLWLLINDSEIPQLVNFETTDYLKFYELNDELKDHPYYEIVGSKGICDMHVYNNIIEKDNEITNSTIIEATVYINYSFDKAISFNSIYIDEDDQIGYENGTSIHIAGNVSSTLTRTVKSEEKIDDQIKIFEAKVTLEMVDTLKKVIISEYNINEEFINSTELTVDEQRSIRLDETTDYVMITEFYEGRDGEYTLRSLVNRKEITGSKTFLLKFTNEYGFVNGSSLTLSI